MTDNTLFEAFLTLHRGLPRQGPGSDATTRRLLSLAGPLPERPRILDLGCGPGRSALLLAAETGAEVTAVDLCEGFLDELRAAAAARGLTGRVRPVLADMGALPFADGSFDLVWAESSVYNIGFDTALREWKRLLAPGGALVLTECVWTAAEPSREARAFWEEHYTLRGDGENTAAAEAAGYEVLGVHPQPESDWDEYYGPLGARAAAADGSAPGMAEAVAGARAEIAMRRDHGGEYGYSGYVLRPAGARGTEGAGAAQSAGSGSAVSAGAGSAASSGSGSAAAGWVVREERAGDREAVFAVHAAAFPTPYEAELVDALRGDDAWIPGFSYVAQAPDGSVAAHALVTRCHIDGVPSLALAPVATAPEFQRTGAGSAVVRAVLDAVRRSGAPLVLVLGHPGYYPRFGFEPAGAHGVGHSFEVPDEVNMLLVLDGSVPVPVGTIRYPAPFGV